MKLILKTILHKKWGSIALLTMLSCIVLLSSRITVTLYSKNLSLAQRVDSINGAHLHIYQTLYGADYDIDAVMSDDISYETTYAFRFNNGNFDNDIFIEGYTSNGTNLYEVLEGKPLYELSGFEIAITESYARSLKRLGIEPMGYAITFPGLDDDSYTFQVVSIVDYPNFNDGYMGINRLKNIRLFDYPFVSVALANYDTVAELAQRHSFDSRSRLVYKIRFRNYSRDFEQDFVKRVADRIDVSAPYEISFIPLFEIAQMRSTSDILYQFLSVIILAGLMISSAYTFYLFLRKQLMQDAQTIGTMVLQGIRRQNLQIAYAMELFFVVLGSMVAFGIMNAWLNQILQHDRSIASVLDTNAVIMQRTLLLYGAYVLLLLVLFLIQLQRYINNALTIKKTQDYLYIKQRNIRFRWYTTQLALRQLIASWRHSLGSVLSISVILLTLFVMFSSYWSVSRIYDENTLGITFDYIVGTAPFEVYDKAKQISNNTVMLEKVSNLYFVDIDFSEDKRTYYRSNFLIFKNRMNGFVKPVIGKAVDILPEQQYLDERIYLRYVAASRRHKDIRNLRVYGTAIKDIEKEYLFYMSAHRPGSKESAAPIHGFVNTLIDNGWIAYDLRFQSEKLYDNVDKPVQMFLVNVEYDIQRTMLEEILNENGISYLTFEEVLRILNEMNQDVNASILKMMLSVGVILMLLLVSILTMNIRCSQMEQHRNNTFLMKIGVKKQTIQRKMIVQQLLIVVISMLFCLLLLPLVQNYLSEGLLKAYGLFSMPELPLMTYAGFLFIPLGIFALIYLMSKPSVIKN